MANLFPPPWLPSNLTHHRPSSRTFSMPFHFNFPYFSAPLLFTHQSRNCLTNWAILAVGTHMRMVCVSLSQQPHPVESHPTQPTAHFCIAGIAPRASSFTLNCSSTCVYLSVCVCEPNLIANQFVLIQPTYLTHPLNYKSQDGQLFTSSSRTAHQF